MATKRKKVEAETIEAPKPVGPACPDGHVALQNLHSHRANTSVLVNGHRYQIDAAGVAIVLEADAAKMLSATDTWQAWSADYKVVPRLHVTQLITIAGDKIERPKQEETEQPAEPTTQQPQRIITKSAEARKLEAEAAAAASGQPAATPPAPPEPPAFELQYNEKAGKVAVPGTETIVNYPEVPDISSGETWPDPDPAMSMDYLRKMADAYGVEHKRVAKAELLEHLNKVMFDEEPAEPAPAQE